MPDKYDRAAEEFVGVARSALAIIAESHGIAPSEDRIPREILVDELADSLQEHAAPWFDWDGFAEAVRKENERGEDDEE